MYLSAAPLNQRKRKLTQRRKGATKSGLRCAFASLRETASILFGQKDARTPRVFTKMRISAEMTCHIGLGPNRREGVAPTCLA